MNLNQIVREGKLSRRLFLKSAAVLGGFFLLGGCEEGIKNPMGPEINDPVSDPVTPTPQYNNITGTWDLSTRSDFGNDNFKVSVDVNYLNLTQTNELAPGYTKDVYKITGNFSDFGWLIQRKSDGTLYPLQNAYGNIINGRINATMTSHNLEFYLGSQNFRLRGVAPGYEKMWGDIMFKVNMTSIYGTSDGIITLTGMWDGERK